MKVIIFDDVLCRREGEYQVPDLDVQIYPHADDAVAVVTREQPTVVLMDYSMEAQLSGEDAIRKLRGAFPRDDGDAFSIVGISSDERSNDRMRAAGADDVVPKTHVRAYLSRLARYAKREQK